MSVERTIVADRKTTTIAHLRNYMSLCKPKVVALIAFTALVGMLLVEPGLPPLHILFFGLVGISLAAASGAAVNHWVDRHIDLKMARTNGRPLPKGDISPGSALVFAVGLGVIGLSMLVVEVNALTAALTALSLIGYAIIYTVFLKHATPYNIVWGGAAGAAPPLLGWIAVTGQVQLEALLLFAIIFVWTPPHFWALAVKRRREYAKAGVPMLPVTHGVDFTTRQITRYVVVLNVVTAIPALMGMSGPIYLVCAMILGLLFLRHALRLQRTKSDAHAMQTFGFSITYLMILFGALLLDHHAGKIMLPAAGY